jgi:hypothetical protein
MLLLLLLQWMGAQPVLHWDGKSTVELTVGTPVRVQIPKCCERFAVSTALGPYALTFVGNQTVELTAAAKGRGLIIAWLTNGERINVPLQMSEPPRKPVTLTERKIHPGDATLITLPEDIADLREVPGDGGVELEVTGTSGEKYRVSVTPVPRSAP